MRPTVSQPTRSSPQIGGARHLLGQPRGHVLEVARVRRARARPRQRLHPHPAGAAAQQPQLALDHAAIGAQIEEAPALDAAVMDLELTAGLTAGRADAPAATQPHGHDHRLGGEADVDDGCPGQTEQPLECGGDAHVALLREPLTIRQPAACAEGGGASLTNCATSAKFAKAPLSAQARAERGLSGRHFTPKTRGDP